MFFWNSLAFSMIQQKLAIWSLVPLPFLKPAWTSGSSWFMYCWSVSWRILSKVWFRGFQIRATMRYNYLPMKMTKIQRNWQYHILAKMRGVGPLINCREWKWYSQFGRQFLTKLNIVLLYSPTVRLLNYLPNIFENLCLQKNMHVDISSFLYKTKNWRQTWCHLIGE